MQQNSTELHYQLVSVGEIEEDPNQPRKSFDKDTLEELAANIEDTAGGSDRPWIEGLLHPIVIYPNPAYLADARDAAPYRVLVGARRLRAYRLRGWPVIPARVVANPGSAARAILTQLNENAGREETSLYEEASAVALAVEAWQAEHPEGKLRDFAAAYNRSPAWVSKHLAVARATGVTLLALREGHLRHTEACRLFTKLSIEEQRGLLARARREESAISKKQVREVLRRRKQSAQSAQPAPSSAGKAKGGKKDRYTEDPHTGDPPEPPEGDPAPPAASAAAPDPRPVTLRLTPAQLRRLLLALGIEAPEEDGELKPALLRVLRKDAPQDEEQDPKQDPKQDQAA